MARQRGADLASGRLDGAPARQLHRQRHQHGLQLRGQHRAAKGRCHPAVDAVAEEGLQPGRAGGQLRRGRRAQPVRQGSAAGRRRQLSGRPVRRLRPLSLPQRGRHLVSARLFPQRSTLVKTSHPAPRRLAAGLLIALLSGTGAWAADLPKPGAASGQPNASAFAQAQAKFEQDYATGLRKPDGWPSVIGLHWIEPGKQSVGGADGNGIKLAIAPATLGVIEERGQTVYFTPAKAAAITVDGKPLDHEIALAPEGHDGGTQLVYDGGKGKISLIKRADRLALRVRHADAPTRLNFAGVDFYPANPAWAIKARFHPNPPGTTLPIANIIGNVTDTPNPGYVEFEKNGKTWRLQALGDPSKSLNFIFRDGTSGKTTYPNARFLRTGPVAADGTVLIDFNRAYNPPCAYTAYATCPLPPRENLLSKTADGQVAQLAVEAGEKKYRGQVDH
ncbi:DUF1684 domain-containing protein [Pseudoxanthomonas winnipegensis]|nr:DUF1684 domain-containing protein [Pseudoxanthomonas winnipegensis]